MRTSMTNNEVKQLIIDLLAETIDPALSQNAFHRSKKGLTYKRPLGIGNLQTLEIVFYYRPKYSQAHDAHIYPFVNLIFPEVNRVAAAMIGDQQKWLGWLGEPKITLRQQIDLTAPLASRRQWYFSGRSEATAVMCELRDFVTKWTLPFFDEYGSVESYVAGFENSDERLGKAENNYLFLLAAHLVLGYPERADALLKSRFSGAFARQRYASVYSYVADRLSQQ